MCNAFVDSDGAPVSDSVNDGVIDGDGDEDSVSVEARISQLVAFDMAVEALGLDHAERVLDARERIPLVNRRRALIAFAQDNDLPVGNLATAPKTVVQSLELVTAIMVNEVYSAIAAVLGDNPQPVSAQDDPNPTRSVDFGI